MRGSRLAAGIGIVVLTLGATASSAAAVDVAVLPMKGPPGAPVTVHVSSCPTGTTDSAAVRFRAAGGTAPPFNPSERGLVVKHTTGGGTDVDVTIPTTTTPGAYAFDVFCVSEGGGVTAGPVTVAFQVAFLPVTVNPRQGPVGTAVTVSGSGCPTGTTDQVFVRIRGAGDDVPPFDPTAPGTAFHTTPHPDGSFSLSFTVPNSAPLGENAVESFCISEGGSVLAGPGFGVFVVTSTGELARTGSTTAPLALAGVAMLLVGLVVVLTRRALRHIAR